MEIPNLTVDIMQEYLRGQARINMDLRATREFSDLLRHLVRNLLMGFWVVALLISSRDDTESEAALDYLEKELSAHTDNQIYRLSTETSKEEIELCLTLQIFVSGSTRS